MYADIIFLVVTMIIVAVGSRYSDNILVRFGGILAAILAAAEIVYLIAQVGMGGSVCMKTVELAHTGGCLVAGPAIALIVIFGTILSALGRKKSVIAMEEAGDWEKVWVGTVQSQLQAHVATVRGIFYGQFPYGELTVVVYLGGAYSGKYVYLSESRLTDKKDYLVLYTAGGPVPKKVEAKETKAEEATA